MTASTVSERSTPCAASGRLLANGRADVVTDADPAADLGQRAGVDDGGTEFGRAAPRRGRGG